MNLVEIQAFLLEANNSSYKYKKLYAIVMGYIIYEDIFIIFLYYNVFFIFFWCAVFIGLPTRSKEYKFTNTWFLGLSIPGRLAIYEFPNTHSYCWLLYEYYVFNIANYFSFYANMVTWNWIKAERVAVPQPVACGEVTNRTF